MIKKPKKTKFVYFFFTIEKTNKTGHYIKINTFLVIHMNYEKIYRCTMQEFVSMIYTYKNISNTFNNNTTKVCARRALRTAGL